MQPFRTKSHRNNHYISSFSLVGLFVLSVYTLAALIYFFVEKDASHGVHILNCFLGLFFLLFIQRAAAGKARCSICPMRPMVPTSCGKSPKASRLIGSYRMKVAVDTLVKQQFRCQYCGECTTCGTRDKTAREHRSQTVAHFHPNPDS